MGTEAQGCAPRVQTAEMVPHRTSPFSDLAGSASETGSWNHFSVFLGIYMGLGFAVALLGLLLFASHRPKADDIQAQTQLDIQDFKQLRAEVVKGEARNKAMSARALELRREVDRRRGKP